MSTYREAGVDIAAGDRTVDLIAAAVASTATDAVLSEIGGFGGLFAADALGPGRVLAASTDGVGTKVELAARYRRWRGLGHDIVNHCVNDILVVGARPLFFLDYVATAHLVPETVAEIVGGMADACRGVGCALLGGETAEMPGVYVPGTLDVAGTIVGVADRQRLLPRTAAIEPGDVLVGLPGDGPHTNGYSLIRQVIDDSDLDDEMVDWLLASHRCYLADVDHLGRLPIDLKALVHVTGGGFIENIPRILPPHLGARIDLGSWSVPPGFARLAEWGGVTDEEAFRVWNMGLGMIAVIAPAAAAVPAVFPVVGEVVAAAGERVTLEGRWR